MSGKSSPAQSEADRCPGKFEVKMAPNSELAQNHEQPCVLFELPAEIRNVIYNLALIEDDGNHFDVEKRDPSQPALLETCKQIRHEAAPIFYHGYSWFTVWADCNKIEPQEHHWVWNHLPKDSLFFIISGSVTWEAVKQWLHLLYDGKVGWTLDQLLFHNNVQKILEKLFQIVEDMKGTPWEVVEKVIDSFKAGIDLALGLSWPDEMDTDE